MEGDRLTNRQIDRQTDGQAGRNRDREIGISTDERMGVRGVIFQFDQAKKMVFRT